MFNLDRETWLWIGLASVFCVMLLAVAYVANAYGTTSAQPGYYDNDTVIYYTSYHYYDEDQRRTVYITVPATRPSGTTNANRPVYSAAAKRQEPPTYKPGSQPWPTVKPSSSGFPTPKPQAAPTAKPQAPSQPKVAAPSNSGSKPSSGGKK